MATSKGLIFGAVAILITLSSAASADSARRWSITPPAGWSDVSDAAREQPEMQAHLKELKTTLGGTWELTQYAKDDAALQILFALASSEGAGGAEMLRGWESGARKSVVKAGSEVSYQRTVDAKVVIIDQVATINGATLRMRRIAGFDTSDQLVTVQATCLAAQAVCDAPLKSLTLDHAGIKLLPANDSANDSSVNRSERLGEIVGMGFIVVLFGVWLWRRGR